MFEECMQFSTEFLKNEIDIQPKWQSSIIVFD